MARIKKRAQRYHHHVYVVELSREVLYEPGFKRCNPGYDPARPCVSTACACYPSSTRLTTRCEA